MLYVRGSDCGKQPHLVADGSHRYFEDESAAATSFTMVDKNQTSQAFLHLYLFILHIYIFYVHNIFIYICNIYSGIVASQTDIATKHNKISVSSVLC